MSLYMYRFDVVNTNTVLHGALSPERGTGPSERRLRHINTHSGAGSMEFQGVIACLPRELATKSLKRSGLHSSRSHVPRLDAHAHITLSYPSYEPAPSS